MQFKLRAFITLIAAGSIIFGVPALGYAQQQSSQYARVGAPSRSFDVRENNRDNDEAADNDNDNAAVAVSDNDNDDNSNDNAVAASNNDNDDADNQDTADNENGNDNIVDAGNEADFLRAAISDSATEIQAGKLAQQQAGSDEIRQLGARMVSDNQAAMADAANVGARYGVGAQEQPATYEEQVRIADLSGRSGEDFDRVYLKSLVWDQRSDISQYEVAERHLRDDVAEYANQHRWMLDDQLQAARAVAEHLGVDID